MYSRTFRSNVGRWKCKVVKPNCNVVLYYIYVKSKHVKKMIAYYTTWEKILVTNIIVMGDGVGEREKKFLLFLATFWLLKQGHLLIDFEAMKILFQTLKVKNTPKKKTLES